MTDDCAKPVSTAEFANVMARLGAPSSFAIAVSGGRDSMALARLAARYGREAGAKIVALTVDHGLRRESAAETAQTAERCRALGLTHHTLSWAGEKPSSGIQAAARCARYRLLADAAHRAGVMAILTAHSADDVAETMVMRLARGAGLSGLAAMREKMFIANQADAPILLLRPLLGFSRAALKQTAADGYLDDPSNDDPTFERVRIRAVLAALGENSIIKAANIAASARRLANSEDARRQSEDALFAALGGCFYRWGGASVDRLSSNAETSGVFARLVFAIGGGAYAPSIDAVTEVLGSLRGGGAVTIGGALIKKTAGRIWILREPAALLGRAGVAPMPPQGIDGAVLWDRRFIVTACDKARRDVVPLGAHDPEPPVIPGAPLQAILTIPGILQSGQLIGAPSHPFMAPGGATAISLAPERFAGEIVRF